MKRYHQGYFNSIGRLGDRIVATISRAFDPSSPWFLIRHVKHVFMGAGGIRGHMKLP
jgi:hypothetical protein